ncbi:MAG: hypothetical protein HYT76_03515 [Deltaproteobacteria bacterium]|nr:hypothetical protein [Deltaproteobacteria bacterium]
MVDSATQTDLISYILEVWRAPRSPFASYSGGLTLASRESHPFSLLRPSLSDFRQVLDGNEGVVLTFLERGLDHQRRLVLGSRGLEASETADLLQADTQRWAESRFQARCAFIRHQGSHRVRTARELRESLRMVTVDTTVRSSIAERALVLGRNPDEVVALYLEGVRLYTEGGPASGRLSRFSPARGLAYFHRLVELVSVTPACPLVAPDLDLGAGITTCHPIEILRDTNPTAFHRLMEGRRDSLTRYLADLSAHEAEIGRVLSELPGSAQAIAFGADHSLQTTTIDRVQGALATYTRRPTVAATDALRDGLAELVVLSHSRIGIASEAFMTSQRALPAVCHYLHGLNALLSRAPRGSGVVVGLAVAFLGLSLFANSA